MDKFSLLLYVLSNKADKDNIGKYTCKYSLISMDRGGGRGRYSAKLHTHQEGI